MQFTVRSRLNFTGCGLILPPQFSCGIWLTACTECILDVKIGITERLNGTQTDVKLVVVLGPIGGMVFYFSTNAHREGEDAWLIYMGKDKHENEDLIRHGWPVDVWYAYCLFCSMSVV